MSTVWIRVAYGAVVALLVAFTVVFGIAMVSPGPRPPGDPGITFRQLSGNGSGGGSPNQLQAQIEQFFGDASRFRGEFPKHQRNVFLAATGLGILVILIGLALPAAVNYLRWGLLLGGVLLFVYAFVFALQPVPKVTPAGSSALDLLGAGSPAQLNFASRFIEFAVAFIGLILTLFLGLWRLTEWSPPQRRAVAVAPAGPAVPPDSSPWAPAPSTAPAAAAVVPPPAPAAAPPRSEGPPPAGAGGNPVEAHAPEWRRPE